MLHQKYDCIQAQSMKTIEASIKEDVGITNAIKAFNDGGAATTSGRSTSGTTPVPAVRTLASPDWDGEQPVSVQQTFTIPAISLADFQSGNTLLGKTSSYQVHTSLHICSLV